MYIPKPVRIELDDLMKERSIYKKSEALNQMAKYSKVGRTAEKMQERLIMFDIFKKKKK